jgi:type I restriction enzyme, S subunit
MAVKPGYKQTPEEWEAQQIRGVCKLINGRGFKPHEWKTSGLPIIRIQNLNGSEDFNYYTGSYNPKILVETGQLLFAWSGSRGTSFGPHVWNGGRALLNYHTWKVVVNESKATQEFLLHALRHLTSYIEDRAHGASALVHTQKWEMEKFPILIPSSLSEQHAIAGVLSDVDALIGALDQLIAKKRDLKQAAMQQLLTGQKRLPGFHGEWAVKRLGELAEIISGGTPKTNEPSYWNGSIKWCTPTDITGCSGKYLLETERTISTDGLASCSAQLLPVGSLLLCSRATIGEVRIAACEICTNQGFKALVCKPRVCNELLYYKLLMMKSQMIERAIGSTFLEISKKDTAALELSVPEHDEQTAIADVLSDMDTELAALEQRRDKTRALKQGMMQELLTGRTRLV